jgi:hypothetical protein
MVQDAKTELIIFYNRLLEAERAGVQALNDISSRVIDKDQKNLLMKFLQDEGMNCQILRTFIKNADGEPTSKVGDFIDKIRALSTIEEQLSLLIKGQEWVAKYIRRNRDLLLKTSTQMFMESIKIRHEENVDTLKKYVDTNEENRKLKKAKN